MTSEMWDRYTLEAIITEREAMIAENESRKARGHSPAYGEDAFMSICHRIIELKMKG